MAKRPQHQDWQHQWLRKPAVKAAVEEMRKLWDEPQPVPRLEPRWGPSSLEHQMQTPRGSMRASPVTGRVPPKKPIGD